ncbi:MAG: anthranilate phosphoribosyltransferase [Acidobacteriota bacterium]
MVQEILQHYLHEFRAGREVASVDSEPLFDAMITERDERPISDVLAAWNKKGISEDELFEFASIMRKRMRRIYPGHKNHVDMVGTGGSRAKTFNVSTAAAFVIAGAGTPVAKHGNRAATSNSGSSDVLALLGIEVDIDPKRSERHLNEYGLSFLFAPRFHSLSATLASARRSLGEPTIFNNLGPLCNPASAPHHIIGVAGVEQFERTANVLARLGTERSWVVRGEDGLDEISLAGMTQIAEVTGHQVERLEIGVEDFGLRAVSNTIPANCSARESEQLIRGVLSNQISGGNAEKLVLINAAAALHVAGSGLDLRQSFELAESSIRSGAAIAKLKILASETTK